MLQSRQPRQMELLKVAIAFQALSLCTGLQENISLSQKNISQSEGTDDPASNQTDAFTPQLSGNCSGTLGLFDQMTWTAILLTPKSVKKVANRICKHLGCMKVVSVSHNAQHNATCLTNCTYSDFKMKNCTEASQIDCTNVTEIVCESSVNKAARLVGGSNRCEGRVEVWNAGKWEGLCGDGWDLEAASVVCRQLRCGNASSVTGDGRVYGEGSSPMLSGFNCTGTESNLWDCPVLSRSNCSHTDNATVVCTESPGVQHTTTAAMTTGTSTTIFVTTAIAPGHTGLSPGEVGCIILSLLLAMSLAVNAVLCWCIRRTEKGDAAVVELCKHDLTAPTEQQKNDYLNTDNSQQLPTGTTGNEVVLNRKPLSTQHSIDTFSVTSDYEPYDFSLEPSVALATFKNSLRNRNENRSPTLKPSALYCLTEEGTEQASGLTDDAALPGCNENSGGFPATTENHINSIRETESRAVPSEESFDSSSTSSGEWYENAGSKGQEATQGDALPAEITKEGEASVQQGGQCDPKLDASDSSSTSSGECYENTGKEAELHVQEEMTRGETPIQAQSKNISPGLTKSHQPDHYAQEDSFDSSSTSSGECYVNTEREAEQRTQGDSSSTSSGADYDIPEGQEQPLLPAEREPFDQYSSDSDYDDVANYILRNA
ncbi:hypothetical protein GJAV_G00019520 [Gymnothorax javanicus]|nr:hypothetical protein GJAV_G00019520 [Gymnothorax javanicus]